MLLTLQSQECSHQQTRTTDPPGMCPSELSQQPTDRLIVGADLGFLPAPERDGVERNLMGSWQD